VTVQLIRTDKNRYDFYSPANQLFRVFYENKEDTPDVTERWGVDVIIDDVAIGAPEWFGTLEEVKDWLADMK
jgi:hypothetical protein